MHTPSLTTIQAAEIKVANLISRQLEDRAVKVLEECLDATVTVRSGRGEHGIDYAERPDHAVRLAAAVRIVEFSRGKAPTSMTLIQPPGAGARPPSQTDLATMLSKQPELARRIMDVYAESAKQALPSASAPSE